MNDLLMWSDIDPEWIEIDDTDKPTENDYCSFAERRSDG